MGDVEESKRYFKRTRKEYMGDVEESNSYFNRMRKEYMEDVKRGEFSRRV